MQLPEKLLRSLQDISGFDEMEFIKTHQGKEQITSIRRNPQKTFDLPCDTSEVQSVPWSSYGYYLAERPSFTFDPLFHAGAYYVQEASSMFLEQALKQSVDLTKPLSVLDLCAAPGGKSTLIQSLISKESLLISNETIKSRVHVLIENLIKWGGANVVVTNNDPKDFARLADYFDVMVIDAPCSGSGLFRRDTDAISQWSPETVNLCSQRQQRILADAWPALKQNGILIYSTCSYSTKENEEILDWMLENLDLTSIRLQVDDNWNIVETVSHRNNGYGYRFYPDKIKGEGFFIAVMKKNEQKEFLLSKYKKSMFEKPAKPELAIASQWLKRGVDLAIIKKDNLVYALPGNSINDINLLHTSLYIKKAGVCLGRITSHELIPDHELALSNIINPEINALTLTKEQAIQYLRKQDLAVETNLKGWAVVKFKNQNLGWIKILQNRLNNYYPSAWRILKREDQIRL